MTYNLCVDMHRERNRSARSIENLEEIAGGEDESVTSTFESPDSAVLRQEMNMYIQHAIDALPPRLREPFILRCCQEKAYHLEFGVSIRHITYAFPRTRSRKIRSDSEEKNL